MTQSFTHIIVKEIHEREKLSDLLLTVLRDMLDRYPTYSSVAQTFTHIIVDEIKERDKLLARTSSSQSSGTCAKGTPPTSLVPSPSLISLWMRFTRGTSSQTSSL